MAHKSYYIDHKYTLSDIIVEEENFGTPPQVIRGLLERQLREKYAPAGKYVQGCVDWMRKKAQEKKKTDTEYYAWMIHFEAYLEALKSKGELYDK